MTAAQPLTDLPSHDDLDFLPAPGWDPAPGLSVDRLFDLQDGVGAGQANRHDDVCRLQALLHLEGYLDAAATPDSPIGGPTGNWGARDDYALRKFQRDNGLDIDGIVRPGGETLETMRSFSQ